VVRERAVVIEVDCAELPPEYGLPGYTVLPALLVTQTHELFELRILCRPGSKLYQRLQTGIEKRRNPVLRVSGYFMKCHAKRTNVVTEPPWRAPLLVAPEPSLSRHEYDALQALRDTRQEKYLPSFAIPAPKAEERLVAELVPDEISTAKLRVAGEESPLDRLEWLKLTVERLRSRLPDGQASHPSGVLLRTGDLPETVCSQGCAALKDAGITRIYVKDEQVALPAMMNGKFKR
jgi:hypothetical protein